MKTTTSIGKFTAIAAIVALGFVSSCKDEETVGVLELADASSESLADSYFQDADDMSLKTLDDNFAARTQSDYRLGCENTSVTFTEGSNTTSGTMIIDFGTGCTDSKGNVRMGKINLAYSNGPIGSTGFTVAETFENYYINSIKLEGTRTITRQASEMQSEIIHDIELVNGKATWPDATFATRTSSFTRTIDLDASMVRLTGSANGTGRRGKSYTMTIEEDVIYRTSCTSQGIYLPDQGVKHFVIDGTKDITIDYGDATCDQTVTVTFNDFTKDITIGKK